MRFRPRTLPATVALIAALAAPARAATGDAATSDAFARAAGNRKAQAQTIGETLFRTVWPAQILKVRVDGEGGHDVAGLIVSGVKFHRGLDAAAFTDEIVAIAKETFAASGVEEIDIWATIPIPVGAHEIVAGDLAQPTSLTVYTATIRRNEGAAFAGRLRRGGDVYWDPAWKATLTGR